MLNFIKNNKLFLAVILFVCLNVSLLYYFCEINLLAMIILISVIYIIPFICIYINSKKNNDNILALNSNKKIKTNYIEIFIYTLLYVIMSSALLGFIEHIRLMYALKTLIVNDTYLELLKNTNNNVSSMPISQIIRLFITSCLLAPLFEEFIFRGFLFKKLLRKRDIGTSIGISSFLFSCFYLLTLNSTDVNTIIGNIITVMISGSLLCVIYLRYNNLKLCIISHSIMNLMCLLYKIYLPVWYKNLLITNIVGTAGIELFVLLLVVYIFIRYYRKNKDLFVIEK